MAVLYPETLEASSIWLLCVVAACVGAGIRLDASFYLQPLRSPSETSLVAARRLVSILLQVTVWSLAAWTASVVAGTELAPLILRLRIVLGRSGRVVGRVRCGGGVGCGAACASTVAQRLKRWTPQRSCRRFACLGVAVWSWRRVQCTPDQDPGLSRRWATLRTAAPCFTRLRQPQRWLFVCC